MVTIHAMWIPPVVFVGLDSPQEYYSYKYEPNNSYCSYKPT